MPKSATKKISAKIRSLEAERVGKRESYEVGARARAASGSCDDLSALERRELRCGLLDQQGAGDRNASKLLTLLDRAEDAAEVLTQLSCVKADAKELREEVESLTDRVLDEITLNPEVMFEELMTDRGLCVSQELKEELTKLVEKTIKEIRSDVQLQISQVIATAQKHATKVGEIS